MSKEILCTVIESSIKRAINFVDKNPFSATYGFADRAFWSWRTKDFNNGSLQSLIFSFASIKTIFDYKEIYKNLNRNKIIDTTYEALKFACFKELEVSGSSQESFPEEKSFCVTGTLLAELISALEITNELNNLNLKEKEILKKSAIFISKNIESHANIGNHLMSSLYALTLYDQKIEFGNKIVLRGIENIVNKLNSIWFQEGWFQEYDGADIGYSTLSLQYLLEIDEKYLPSKNDWIVSMLNFITYFFHLDGSIGNHYGSRGSSVIYPSSLLNLDFEEINNFMYKAIENKKIPLPNDLDDANFVPLFNSFIRSLNHKRVLELKNFEIPIFNNKLTKVFLDSGFVFNLNNNVQNIVDLNKGGIVYSFTNDEKNHEAIPTIRKLGKNNIFCAINTEYEVHNGEPIIINVVSKFYKINTKSLNSINVFLSRAAIPVIRIFPKILQVIKKTVVSKFFIPSKSVGSYSKTIFIDNYKLTTSEKYTYPNGFEKVEGFYYHPIRMASQNYLN